MSRLTRIHTPGAEYAFLADGTGPGGSLIVKDEGGDTLLPPYEGRWTVLGEAQDLADASVQALAWEAEAPRA